MAMNTKKIVAGGIAAGIVLCIIDFVVQYMMGARMKAESDAFKPGLSDAMMTSGAITTFVISDIVVGILLVWTYAAIRPRFGPGPKTAISVAVLFWIFGSILQAGYLMMGVMSMGTWWMFGIAWLVNLIISANVGAMIYSEDAA